MKMNRRSTNQKREKKSEKMPKNNLELKNSCDRELYKKTHSEVCIIWSMGTNLHKPRRKSSPQFGMHCTQLKDF